LQAAIALCSTLAASLIEKWNILYEIIFYLLLRKKLRKEKYLSHF